MENEGFLRLQKKRKNKRIGTRTKNQEHAYERAKNIKTRENKKE
jgi:hypothetical protein